MRRFTPQSIQNVPPAQFSVQIYYEDTDHSGVVYHPNYLKFFERAREDLLGIADLLELQNRGLGFAVNACELWYKQGAKFGDRLHIATWIRQESSHRLFFLHRACGETEGPLWVEGEVEMVCLHNTQGLVALPESVLRKLEQSPHRVL